jgi:isopentenyl phosphate kinase
VHVTKTPGVYVDIDKPELGIFKRITPISFAKLSSKIRTAEGTDVTGGMLEKVKQAIDLAQDGIDSVIMNNDDSNLVRLICENKLIGTRISI